MVVELGLADANYKTVDWQTGSQGGSKGCTYIGKGKGGFLVNEHVNVDKFLGAAEHQGNVPESFCKLRIAFVGDA